MNTKLQSFYSRYPRVCLRWALILIYHIWRVLFFIYFELIFGKLEPSLPPKPSGVYLLCRTADHVRAGYTYESYYRKCRGLLTSPHFTAVPVLRHFVRPYCFETARDHWSYTLVSGGHLVYITINRGSIHIHVDSFGAALLRILPTE
jgi:hypothetical protein